MKMFPLACLMAALPTMAQAEPPRVVVIGIDKRTQAELGPFGGSYRGTHAELIKKLNASGVKGIAFAMDFAENPERAADTAKLAAAAKSSPAPVVVGVYTFERNGQIGKESNATVLQDPKIGQGVTTIRRELTVVQDGDALEARTGAITVMSDVGGHRSLVEELLRRTGQTKPGQLEELGLVEQIPTGFQMNDAARTQGLEHGYSHTPGLRPELDQ